MRFISVYNLSIIMICSRKQFLRKWTLITGGMFYGTQNCTADNVIRKAMSEIRSTIYRSVNGSSAENMVEVLELMGGIERIFGPDDVIVIKPNLQWWNQGAPNLNAILCLVDLIMERPGGFDGEVVIAENCHRGNTPWVANRSGWAHRFEWNADNPEFDNANELAALLKKRYSGKFSIRHMIDVKGGGKRVYGPGEGDGYVYCDGTGGVPLIDFDNGATGENNRRTIMTYPVFSTDGGTTIDFKNGIWKKGAYTKRPLRFINFAALNHHSEYCGMTSAVKNYFGVTDLSGGGDPSVDGHLTDRYYNFHAFAFNEWTPGPVPGMLGAEIAVFMNTIRKADLNIVTAEWTGLVSRNFMPVAHTKTVLASTDPVALDYHAAKYVLYPNSKIGIHNPDNKKSPLNVYLNACSAAGGGNIDEQFVDVSSFDFLHRTTQKQSELVIKADKTIGTNIKQILKYIYLRTKYAI